MELALGLSTALSRTPATERSEVEGDPGPSARSCREAAPNLTFRRGLPLREALGWEKPRHERSGPHALRAVHGGLSQEASSSPAGGHIDTGRPGRWPRVEASRPPRGLRRLSVRRPSDLKTGGGVKAGGFRSSVGAARAPHHHRASCPSSPGCCFIIVGLFPHHRRVTGPSPAPPPRARRSPAASPARRRW